MKRLKEEKMVDEKVKSNTRRTIVKCLPYRVTSYTWRVFTVLLLCGSVKQRHFLKVPEQHCHVYMVMLYHNCGGRGSYIL